MISVDAIGVEYSGHTLFSDISFVINEGDRIALMGKNGAGKSTIMKIIAGIQKANKGNVRAPKEAVIAYLPQHLLTEDNCTVFEETSKAFQHIFEMRDEIEALNKQLETLTDYESKAYMDVIHKVSDLGEKYYSLEDINYDSEVEKALFGLGFKREDFNRQTSEFSGGWRMRIELAKILLQKPDLILLDDAFQHRRITGNLNIVCTTFSKPFFEDQMMPMGRLRESISGIHRADALFVNRCPQDFNASEFTRKAIKYIPDSIPIFYTQVQYGEIVGPLPKKNKWHLIAGIADPLPFSEYVSSQFQVISERIFPDHHAFSYDEISELNQMAQKLPVDEGILTTHKDYMRFLDSFSSFPDLKQKLHYLPIEMSFVNQEKEFWAWLANKMKR